LGWQPGIPYNNQGGKISMREFLAYRLHIRTDESNHIFRCGKLFMEYLVDSWAICEQSRLNYIKMNQGKLRVDQYADLAAEVEQNPEIDHAQAGTRIILPSSFTGSTRHMQACCQDALALNRHFKGADFFITVTANSYWQEVSDALLPGQKPEDRPDIVNRVFHAKLESFIKDIKSGVLGRYIGIVYTIEFQKHGLPHCHIIVFLHPDSKLRTPEDVDSMLSSEIPDPDTEPELFQLVTKFMVHGPCGDANPNAPCMKDGRCIRGFPKPFREQTTISDDSYASTRRRNTGRTYVINGREIDNRWIVTYCIFLIWAYRCHINVECVASIKAIKYIYKYIYKGHDRITMEFGRCQDEVKKYLDARYIAQHEGHWRLMAFEMHHIDPSIYRLQVHLPGMQNVTWNEDAAETLNQIVERAANKDTTLTAWFKANDQYPEARDVSYQDFPTKFVFNERTRKWTPRQRGLSLGRMYYVSPKANDSERFYLRLLLTAVKGATSFEHLRTVNDQLRPTFKDACIALGLLDNDQEWHQCLQEAGHMATGHQLRVLFTTILCDCFPTSPRQLWNDHKVNLCDDLRHALQRRRIRENPADEDIWDYGLYLIDQLLSHSNKSLRDWPDMPQVQQNWAAAMANRLIAREQDYNADDETQLAQERIAQFNDDQRSAFDKIIQAVDSNSGKSFFLHGPGGTGKTFVYNTVCHFLRGQGKIVLCVASSGIASLLLNGGRTAHSTFKIPIIIHETSICSIKKNSQVANLIRAADLVIWDEAPMQHRHIHEAVDRTLRDIRDTDSLFGGLSIIFGGDFQQILPVIIKGSRADIVSACIQRSYIWRSLEVLHLHRNMRLNVDLEQERDFAKWQLDVGHGKHTNESDKIQLPENLRLADNTIGGLIDHIYPNIAHAQAPLHKFFSERMLLSSRNDDVDDINEIILHKFPGQVREFHSADKVINDNAEEELMYPVEYLNGINCSGFPLAHMKLKIGCPVMVLRNLNQAEGVCNGTRGLVTKMSHRVIEIELLTRQKKIFIPRIGLSPSETQVPFKLERKQFPLKLCFAMTVNKSQGQSVEYVGLDFRSAVFTHGQFYVGVSRVKTVNNIKVITDEKEQVGVTKNIVYPEVLLD
jgi:hypothetical protein